MRPVLRSSIAFICSSAVMSAAFAELSLCWKSVQRNCSSLIIGGAVPAGEVCRGDDGQLGTADDEYCPENWNDPIVTHFRSARKNEAGQASLTPIDPDHPCTVTLDLYVCSAQGHCSATTMKWTGIAYPQSPTGTSCTGN